MIKKRYLFQKKKVSFTNRLFEKGLNAAAIVLFAIKENGNLLLDEFPSCYPGLKILKDTFGVNLSKKDFKKKEISINFHRLEKQGLIRKETKKKFYILTEQGKELVSYIQDRYSVLEKKWDGKLRIVVFDIPEKKKFYREWLREELLLLKFKLLQKSVYIGKHPLPKSFYQDIIRFGLGNQVFIFIVDKIDKKQSVIRLLEE